MGGGSHPSGMHRPVVENAVAELVPGVGITAAICHRPPKIKVAEEMLVYHIVTETAWNEAGNAGVYQGDTLTTEGFIHCSTLNQVVPVANNFYRGQQGLVLLEIAPDKVDAELRFENLDGGEELFPHLYGPLQLSAVRQVYKFQPDQYGKFHLPVGLELP